MPSFNPHNPHLQPILDDLLLAHPLVRASKMFGYPACYASKKLCACLYEGGVGFKLPAASAERLLREDPHVVPFQPFGRSRMRAWVHINLPDPEGYRAYQSAIPG
jgi:hypothetical protein